MLQHRHCEKLYAIMHDGTQKFGKELNGVILTEMSNIVNVPWELKEGWGGGGGGSLNG